MGELVLTTYDWVPPPPRGYVRDVRVRWALEEAGLPYRVESTPFRDRKAEHLAHQPFGQVPWLTDGGLSIFESGAILLHIGERSRLLPSETKARSEAKEWLFAALNSVEMASMPWVMFQFMGMAGSDGAAFKWMDDFVTLRLDRLEAVLAQREWLAGDFSVADIMMADVMRPMDQFKGLDRHPACKAYMDRAVARPAFRKAYDDQMAHFAAGDAARA